MQHNVPTNPIIHFLIIKCVPWRLTQARPQQDYHGWFRFISVQWGLVSISLSILKDTRERIG